MKKKNSYVKHFEFILIVTVIITSSSKVYFSNLDNNQLSLFTPVSNFSNIEIGEFAKITLNNSDFIKEILPIDNKLFITSNNLGLQYLGRYFNSNNLVLVNYYSDFWNGETNSLTLLNNILFVSLGYEGIGLINVSSDSFSEIMKYSNNSDVTCLTRKNEVLIIADSDVSIKFFNISNPLSPIFLNQIMIDERIKEIFVDNNNLLALFDSGDIELYNISDYFSIEKIWTYSGNGFICDIDVIENRLFIAGGVLGYEIYDISNPTSPLLIIDGRNQFGEDSQFPTTLHINHKYIEQYNSTLIFAAEGSSGIRISSFDMENSSNLIELDKINNTNTGFYKSWVFNDILYAISNNEIILFDLKYDSDGDLISDGWENYYLMNKNNHSDGILDFDDDDLSNLIEYNIKTNPWSNDTDQDGMDDKWEYNYQLDPNFDDSLFDPDNDGYNNLYEYFTNTDPNNSTSYFSETENTQEETSLELILKYLNSAIYIGLFLFFLLIIITVVLIIKKKNKKKSQKRDTTNEK